MDRGPQCGPLLGATLIAYSSFAETDDPDQLQGQLQISDPDTHTPKDQS